MALHYTGARGGQEWLDLWNVAESVDLTLEGVYRQQGYQGCCMLWPLMTGWSTGSAAWGPGSLPQDRGPGHAGCSADQ